MTHFWVFNMEDSNIILRSLCINVGLNIVHGQYVTGLPYMSVNEEQRDKLWDYIHNGIFFRVRKNKDMPFSRKGTHLEENLWDKLCLQKTNTTHFLSPVFHRLHTGTYVQSLLNTCVKMSLCNPVYIQRKI